MNATLSGNTVTANGQTYEIAARHEPGDNMKKAAPHLKETLFLRGKRGAVKMAYLFTNGTVRIINMLHT